MSLPQHAIFLKMADIIYTTHEGFDKNGKKIAILEAKSTNQPFLAEADTLLRLGILLLVLCFLYI